MARWISGIILAVVVVSLVLLAPAATCQWVVVLLSLLGAWELAGLSLDKTGSGRVMFTILSGCGVVTMAFYQDFLSLAAYAYMILAVGFVLGLFPSAKQDLKQKVIQTAFFVMGLLYVSVGFGFLAGLFVLPHAKFWVFLALAATFLGDTMAYLFGKSWGKHKMAPLISPGKTLEGLMGGLMGGMLAAIVVKMIFWPQFPLVLALALGLMVALIGVIGDLNESFLKRGFGVKDSGTLIPGHGGLLDRVDALLFTAPFVYLVATSFFT